MYRGIIKHVVETEPFADDYFFYRFVDKDAPPSLPSGSSASSWDGWEWSEDTSSEGERGGSGGGSNNSFIYENSPPTDRKGDPSHDKLKQRKSSWSQLFRSKSKLYVSQSRIPTLFSFSSLSRGCSFLTLVLGPNLYKNSDEELEKSKEWLKDFENEETLQKVITQMRDPKDGLSIADRKYHLRKYPDCFVGSDPPLPSFPCSMYKNTSTWVLSFFRICSDNLDGEAPQFHKKRGSSVWPVLHAARYFPSRCQ